MEDAPQRIADLGRRKCAGGNLVGQRLEEVEVAPVDERDLDWHPRKLERGLQASEAAADHGHSMRFLCCDHGWQSVTVLDVPSSSMISVSTSSAQVDVAWIRQFRRREPERLGVQRLPVISVAAGRESWTLLLSGCAYSKRKARGAVAGSATRLGIVIVEASLCSRVAPCSALIN